MSYYAKENMLELVFYLAEYTNEYPKNRKN